MTAGSATAGLCADGARGWSGRSPGAHSKAQGGDVRGALGTRAGGGGTGQGSVPGGLG